MKRISGGKCRFYSLKKGLNLRSGACLYLFRHNAATEGKLFKAGWVVSFLFLDGEIEESLVNGKDHLISNFTLR